MVPFSKKELTPTTTIGEKLKKRRVEKGLNLSDAAEELKIAEKYLAAFENGELENLPGEIYAKNFLQKYSDFLNLDSQEILKEYEQEKSVRQMVQKVNLEAFGKKDDKSTHWYSFITARLLKNLVLVLLIIAGLVFLGLKINNIVAPPQLEIINPAGDNLTIRDSYIEITGQTEIGVKVSINGQDVMINPDGSFKEGVNLQSGLNIIKISASKQYSKTVEIYREVLVEK